MKINHIIQSKIDNKTKLNMIISDLTDFTYYSERKYKAELIKDNIIKNINFIIEKIDSNFYKTYLTLQNTLDLFDKQINEESNIKTINIRTDYIPVIYQLKIYLDDYIIDVPRILLDGDMDIYFYEPINKLSFDVLTTESLEIFSVEKK